MKAAPSGASNKSAPSSRGNAAREVICSSKAMRLLFDAPFLLRTNPMIRTT